MSDISKLVDKTSSLTFLLKQLNKGLDIKDARKVDINQKEEEGPPACSCSKPDCQKCFYWQVLFHLNTLTRELRSEEQRAESYISLIYTHYWFVDPKDLRIKKVGDWKPDPNLWPQAAIKEE